MQPKPRPVLKAASAFIGVHRRVTANRPHYWEASSCHRHCVGAPTATGTASNVGACVSLLQLPPSLQTATNCQRPPWQGRIAVRQSRQQNRLTCRRVENRPAGGWSCSYRYIHSTFFRNWAPSFSPAVNTTAWLHVTQRSAVRFRPTVNYSFRAFLFWFGGRPPSRDNHAQPHQTGAQRRIEPAELQVLISMPFSI